MLKSDITSFSFLVVAFIIGSVTGWIALPSASDEKGFLTCYLSNGVILSKYGNVKHDGDNWSVEGKSFYYETNSKCIFIKDKKSKT